VQSEARRRAGAREHVARSARAGRHGGVWLAGSVCDVRWARGDGVPWNWPCVCCGARWRGDRSGGGRWRAGPAGLPTVGMAMARAAWGFDTESLRGGVCNTPLFVTRFKLSLVMQK
jgi:hypothetical protein